MPKGVMCTSKYLQTWIGQIRFTPEGMNDSRVQAGIARILVGHDGMRPIGIINEVWHQKTGGKFMMDYELPELESTKDDREKIDAGLMDSASVGASIEELEVVDVGEKWEDDKIDFTRWTVLETSATPIPANPAATMRASADLGDPEELDLTQDLLMNAGGHRISIPAIQLQKINRQRMELRQARMTADQGHEAEEDQETEPEKTAEEDVPTSEEPADEAEGETAAEPDPPATEESTDGGDAGNGGDAMDETVVEEAQTTQEATLVEHAAPSGPPPHVQEAMRRLAHMVGEPAAAEQALISGMAAQDFLAKLPTISVNRGAPLTLRQEEGGDLSLGNLVRAQMLQGYAGAGQAAENAKAEMDWIREREISLTGPDGNPSIPFEFLFRHGQRSRQRRLMQEMQQEASGGRVPDGRIRQDSQISDASNAYNVNVNYADSMGWLTEVSPALGMMDVIFRNEGQQNFFWGNAEPAPSFTAEGASATETTPSVTSVTRLPKVVQTYYRMSSSLRAIDNGALETLFIDGAEELVREHLMRAVFSGPNVNASFGANANSFESGLYASLTAENFGNTITNLTRDDITGREAKLVEDKASGMNLMWIVSATPDGAANSPFAHLINQRIGGTESVRFVMENGMMQGYQNLPAYPTVHLGHPTDKDLLILAYGSRCKVVIWGGGVEIIMFRPPSEATLQIGLQMHANFAFVQPKNGTALKKG